MVFFKAEERYELKKMKVRQVMGRDLFCFDDEKGQSIFLDEEIILGGRTFERFCDGGSRRFFMVIYTCIGMAKEEFCLEYRNAEVRDKAFVELRERLASISGLGIWDDDIDGENEVD